jgi:hypothetical protein
MSSGSEVPIPRWNPAKDPLRCARPRQSAWHTYPIAAMRQTRLNPCGRGPPPQRAPRRSRVNCSAARPRSRRCARRVRGRRAVNSAVFAPAVSTVLRARAGDRRRCNRPFVRHVSLYHGERDRPIPPKPRQPRCTDVAAVQGVVHVILQSQWCSKFGRKFACSAL